MLIGGWNPLPAQIGGADPPARAIHLSLRSAVGTGGAGPMWDRGGVEDWWRWCKALITWVGQAQPGMAVNEFLPRSMFYELELWELAMGLPSEGDIEARRAALEVARYAALSGIIAELQEYLRDSFDETITVETTTYERMDRCEAHRYLEGVPAWGEGESSLMANLSSAFHVTVVWPSMTTEAQQRPLHRALNVRLPAWVTHSVVNATVFYLDGGPGGSSFLDLTGLA